MVSLNENQYNLSPQQFVKRFVVVALYSSSSSSSSNIVISIRIQQAFEMNLKITLMKLLFFLLHLESIWLGNGKVEGLRKRWKS